jgi:hypothetical protein
MQKHNLIARGMLLALAAFYCAQAQDSKSIQQKLEAKYALTKTTYDKSGIVSAGSTLTLKVNKIVMVPVNMPDVVQNKYQKGKISQNLAGKASRGASWACGVTGMCGSAPTPQTQPFGVGEKMWVTAIQVDSSAVVFDLVSDASDNGRFKAKLIMPYSAATPAEQVVDEVFSAEAPAAPQPPPTKTATNPVTVPPPPTQSGPAQDANPVVVPPPPGGGTPQVEMGQTPEQVIGIKGQPNQILNVTASKQIYLYTGSKVTFVNNQVSNIQ